MHASPPIGSTLGVAYVVPMGGGIHSFVFREVRELQKLGVQVHLFQAGSPVIDCLAARSGRPWRRARG